MRRNTLLSAFVFFMLVLSVSPNFTSSENIVEIDEVRQNLSTLNNMDFGTRSDMGTDQTAERSDPEYKIKTAYDQYLDQIETKEIATLTNSIFDLLKNTPKENYWTEEAIIIVTFESKENFIQPYFDEYDVDFFNTLPMAVMEVPIGAITEIQELPGVSYDEITLNTYSLSDFDFSLPMEFISAEIDFEDQDEDGTGETLVIIITVEVNEVLDVTFNYYIQFSYDDNYYSLSGFKNVAFSLTGIQEVRIEIDLDNIFFDIPDNLEVYYSIDAYSDELGLWFSGISNWEEMDLAAYVFTTKVTTKPPTTTEETTEDAFLNAPGLILILSSFSAAFLFRRKSQK